jgi:hypothetical protein
MLRGFLTSDPTDVGLRYHVQDDTTFCGAAVAQMMLRPIEGSLDYQIDLAEENVQNDSDISLGSSVKALCTTLNRHGKDSRVAFTSNEALCPDPFSAASEAIITTRCGVAALVRGIDHWVALNGVAYNAGDSSTPSAIYVHDPHAERSLKGSHADNDLCGRGPGLGIPNAVFTSKGMDLFIDLCPTALIFRADSPPARRVSSRTNAPYPPSYPMEYRKPFDPLEVAADSISATGIVDRGPLSGILAGFRPTRSVPVGYYRHITLKVDSCIVGYALIAADNGALLAVMANGEERPLMDVSKDSLMSELYASRDAIELIDPEFMPALDERHAGVKASFFWRLCREAPSPAHPLVRISIGTKMIYRDHFGAFHARLHLLDR